MGRGLWGVLLRLSRWWSTNIKTSCGRCSFFNSFFLGILLIPPGFIACLVAITAIGSLGDAQASQETTQTTLREAERALDKRQYDVVLRLVEPMTGENSGDPAFRRLKIKALLHSSRPVEALSEYGRLQSNLGRDDEPVLREIAMGFIVPTLKDMREQVRGAGYTALKELESDETVHYFEDGLTDGSGLVRTLAAEGLGRLKKGRESPRLRQALEDQAAMVRVAALRGLGRSEDRAAAGVIEKLLKDEQPTVRVAAMGALARLGREEALKQLREAAKASNPDERGAAFRMLGDLGDHGATTILEQGLSDAQPSIRGAAAAALSELEGAHAKAIEPLLADPVPAVRAAAAVSLGELQAKQSAPALKRSLTDSNPAVRAAAVDGLLDMGSEYEIISPTVRELAHSTDPGIRAAAAKAIAKSRSSAAHDALGDLRVLLTDPLPRPRIAAARALGHLRDVDRGELIPTLKRSLTDQDEAVRATGAGALGRVLSGHVSRSPSKRR